MEDNKTLSLPRSLGNMSIPLAAESLMSRNTFLNAFLHNLHPARWIFFLAENLINLCESLEFMLISQKLFFPDFE